MLHNLCLWYTILKAEAEKEAGKNWRSPKVGILRDLELAVSRALKAWPVEPEGEQKDG